MGKEGNAWLSVYENQATTTVHFQSSKSNNQSWGSNYNFWLAKCNLCSPRHSAKLKHIIVANRESAKPHLTLYIKRNTEICIVLSLFMVASISLTNSSEKSKNYCWLLLEDMLYFSKVFNTESSKMNGPLCHRDLRRGIFSWWNFLLPWT